MSYQEIINGVIRLSDGLIISFFQPGDETPELAEYRQWLFSGNVPRTSPPSGYHKWDDVGKVWYADAETDAAFQLIEDNSPESKAADIQANMPSWNQVESYLDGLANLAEAKLALKKIARVVYWLAKNTKA